jgi:hypothetical protein
VDVSRKQRIFNPAHMPNWWFTTAPIVAALATVGIAFGVGYAFSSPSPGLVADACCGGVRGRLHPRRLPPGLLHHRPSEDAERG